MEKDCVFDKGRDCAALNKKICTDDKRCSFCKTQSELMLGRLRAERRRQSLPKVQQKHINDMYYGSRNKGVTDDEFGELC